MTDIHPLTLEQAARRLGVATRTMQRYVEAYDKHGDRSKGFDAIKVATQRGRGYTWRFRLDTDTTARPHPDAPTTPVLDASTSAPDASVAHALVDTSGGQGEALHLVLAALGETRRESADLAYRLGVSETERDELRRRVEIAEAELSRRREEEADAAALFHRRIEQKHRNRAGMQAAQDAPGAAAGASADDPRPAPSAGLWARVRRLFGGGGGRG